MIVSAIVAAAENNVIGRNGDLPWQLPRDMRFFRETTMGHYVIMGRKNWDSIPDKYRPLVGRTNVIVTRNPELVATGADIYTSIEQALDAAKASGEEEAFIIGGGQIYAHSFAKDLIKRVYMTRIHAEIDGDVIFPTFDQDTWAMRTQTFYPADDKHAFAFSIQTWEKADHSL